MMNIDKWWKWVIAVIATLYIIFAIIWCVLKLNNIFYNGDRRCVEVKCVIVK